MMLQDLPHRRPGVGAEIVVQDYRQRAVAQQSSVVGVQVMGNEDPADPSHLLECGDGCRVAAAG